MAPFQKRMLLFIFLFGLFLKICLMFSLPVFHDVGWYYSLVSYHDNSYMNLIVLEHPPFGYYPFFIALNFIGMYDWVIRLVPLLFSIVEILFLYYISKKWFGVPTALYAVILFSLTYFATFNSLSPEGDGSIMGLFSLLLFYCVYEYYRTSQKRFLFFIGIFLGIHFLIKVRTVIFIVPIIIYSYYSTQQFLRTLKDIFLIIAISGALFSVFLLLVYLANPSSYVMLLKQVIMHNTGTVSLFYKLTHPSLFIPICILLSFLYLFLYLKAAVLLLKKESRINPLVLVFLWFTSLFLIILTVLPEGLASAYPRYIAFLAPPLCIICGKGLDLLGLQHKRAYLIVVGSIFLSAIFLYCNQLFPTVSHYWYFVTAAMGIVKISKEILFFVFISSIVLLGVYFLMPKHKKIIISFFLLINFAFNIMLIADPIIDRSHIQILKEFKDYYCTHPIKKPIYLWAEDLSFYLHIGGKNLNLITDPALYAYAKRIGYTPEGYYYMQLNEPISMNILQEKGGTVFSLYYPLKYTQKSGRKDEYMYLETHCTLLKSFDYLHSKGVIYEC